MMRTFFAAVVAVALLSGCGPKEVNFKVTVVSQGCDTTVSPFDGVKWVRISVSGDNLEPIVATSLKDSAKPELVLPQIPAGPNRVVSVRGYDSDPSTSGAKVLAVGQSLPFAVPDTVPTDLTGAIQVNIFARRVGVFTPVSAAASSGTCQKLRTARAGHTATVLKDGRVFIAGGYAIAAGSPVRTALSDAEYFNPATGAFEPAPEMAVNNGITKLLKAFHTATLLSTGQVLLWGGEYYYPNSASTYVTTPSPVVLVFDPDKSAYGPLGTHSTAIARTQHSAVVDASGKVLIVGGLTRPDGMAMQPTDKVQWYNPADATISVVKDASDPTGTRELSFKRVGAGMAPVRGGEFVAVAGGSDGTAMVNDVSFFKFDGSVFKLQAVNANLRLADPGRVSPGVATMRNGDDLVLLGGYNAVSTTASSATSEIVSTRTSTVSNGPAVGARAEVCAVTLQDGSVLGIGGRSMDGSHPVSDATVTLLSADAAGGAMSQAVPALAVGRYNHTCTVLTDGSVLVTGGVSEKADGTVEILQDAWIYTPAPAN